MTAQTEMLPALVRHSFVGIRIGRDGYTAFIRARS
jgi:hypothetical protein